jgi:hypothetical protein
VSADIPLLLSPDGALGYIPIHKNASTTYTFHFLRTLGWGRAWPKGSVGERVKDWVPNPDPTKILVITRREPDRFFSAMHTMNHPEWDAINWSDQHVWPVGRFLVPWMRFHDRMEFVDVWDVPAWLIDNGLPVANDHRNAATLG